MSEYEKAQEVKKMVTELLTYAQKGEADSFLQCVQSYVKEHDQPGDRVTSSTVILGTRDGNGRTALHFSASANQLGIIPVILKDCPDVLNAQDEEGLTSLALALITGGHAVAKCLIEAGADVNIPDKKGVCCIHRAAGHGDTEGVALLSGAGADLEVQSGAGTPLHWAAGAAQLSTVKQLLQLGALSNALSASNGATPLVMAAARGAGDVCEALIEGGADVSICLPGGLTCMHVMAELGLTSALELALQTDKGKECAAAEDDEGRTPLDLAILGGHEACILVLYQYTPHVQNMQVEDVLQKISKDSPETHGTEDKAKAVQEGQEGGSGAPAKAMTGRLLESTDAARSPADLEESLRLKTEGNALLKQKKLVEAVDKYTAAILKDGSNTALWSNRSAVYMELHQYADALADAEVCRRLKPDWPKACYRMAVARLALEMYEDAAVSAWEGVQLDKNNQELKNLLSKSVKLGRKAHFKSADKN